MEEVNRLDPSKFKPRFGQTVKQAYTSSAFKKAVRLHSAWSLFGIESHSSGFENNTIEFYEWTCQGTIFIGAPIFETAKMHK